MKIEKQKKKHEYYLKNREKYLIRSKNRYYEKKEEIRKKKKEYYKQNRETFRKKAKKLRSTKEYREKKYIQDKNYREKNKEMLKQKYLENIEEKRAMCRSYYYRHRNERKKKHKIWKQSLRGRLSIKKYNLLRRDFGYINIDILEKIIKRDKKICQYCFKKCRINGNHIHPLYLTVDHKIPISRYKDFGLINVNDENNLVVACNKCNMNKRNKTPLEFKEYLKR